jgi:hypothetical protein
MVILTSHGHTHIIWSYSHHMVIHTSYGHTHISYVDYHECVEIRERVCGAEDRSVIEAHFIAAMAKLYGGRTLATPEIIT